MTGKYHLNIPPDSEQWLFSPAPLDEGRLWSVGRYEPPCKPGDDLFFKFDGKIVAAATVHEKHPPGLFDNWCHNGKRYLAGWKVVWCNDSFIDLRSLTASLCFACNDHNNGTCIGRFDSFRIETRDEGVSVSLAGAPTTVAYPNGATLRVGRRRFEARGHFYGPGNWCWCGSHVPILDAARVVQHLIEEREFHCDCAPTEIFKSINDRKEFSWRMLLEQEAPT